MKKIFILPILLVTLVFTGCMHAPENSNTKTVAEKESTKVSSFRGTKGEFVALKENKVAIITASVIDGKAHYFNTTLPNGDPVYFFVLKSPDGNIRAAANGCQVCGDALQGFRQEGDYMVCNTCGNKYHLNKVSTEKGGCNPAPISSNLATNNGNIDINLSELSQVQQYF